MINANAMVSISEASRDFSRAARMADEKGAAVIMKDNVPRYPPLQFSRA